MNENDDATQLVISCDTSCELISFQNERAVVQENRPIAIIIIVIFETIIV